MEKYSSKTMYHTTYLAKVRAEILWIIIYEGLKICKCFLQFSLYKEHVFLSGHSLFNNEKGYSFVIQIVSPV